MASACRDARFRVSTLRSSNSESRKRSGKFLNGTGSGSDRAPSKAPSPPVPGRYRSRYCIGPACLNRSRSAHPHSRRLRRLNTICWKRLADASLYASRHSTLHRFNFLRQFAAEKSFRSNRESAGGIDGPCRIRTYNQRIMLTTTAFAAPLTLLGSEFVVWTISSLYVSAASFSPYLSMMN